MMVWLYEHPKEGTLVLSILYHALMWLYITISRARKREELLRAEYEQEQEANPIQNRPPSARAKLHLLSEVHEVDRYCCTIILHHIPESERVGVFFEHQLLVPDLDYKIVRKREIEFKCGGFLVTVVYWSKKEHSYEDYSVQM